jgi:ribosomal protein S12 methylthiotransferase accessory factor
MSDQPSEVNIWAAAADLLDGKAASPADHAEAGGKLLARLEYGPSDATSPAEHRMRLAFLRFAARMSDLFEIAAPDAPGLRFVGGMTRPSRHRSRPLRDQQLSAGGRGRSFPDAFASCVGEAIERVSQAQAEHDQVERCRVDAGLAMLPGACGQALRDMLEDRAHASDVELDWVPARLFPGNSRCMVPADLCLVRPDRPEQQPLSTSSSLGCASGPTIERALLSGLLEVVERDAAALWWLGANPARAVSMEALDEGGIPDLVRDLRRSTATRRTWFLDITTDLAIPCIVSLSFRAEGGGFAHGVAARPTLGAAAAAAFLEMCQMEVAFHLVTAKLATRGEEALTEVERRHKQRFDLLDPDQHGLLLPRLGAAVRPLQLSGGDFHAVVEALDRLGLQCLAVDLTRPDIGIPVFKVIVPGLQPMPSKVRTARLEEAARSNAGLSPVEVPLF